MLSPSAIASASVSPSPVLRPRGHDGTSQFWLCGTPPTSQNRAAAIRSPSTANCHRSHKRSYRSPTQHQRRSPAGSEMFRECPAAAIYVLPGTEIAIWHDPIHMKTGHHYVILYAAISSKRSNIDGTYPWLVGKPGEKDNWTAARFLGK